MNSETVRYEPGEAIRWLREGARSIRKDAERQGRSVVRREGERSIGKDISQAASALFGVGKSALAELAHQQASATEYVLHEATFDAIRPTGTKSIAYSDVHQIKHSGEKSVLILDRGSVTIAPYAFIVSGRIRVPIGWKRNGMEVPYELLIDEISARCGVEIESA